NVIMYDDEVQVVDRGDKFKHSQSSSQINSRKYDGRKRDPQYSNADKTCIWELTVFTNHFHPTVALYAKQLLENISIDPPPELHHHTLSHFLDRFVYRNPKKTDRIKGGNPLLQPTVASEPGMVIMKKGTGISKDEINVNSEEFWRICKDEGQVTTDRENGRNDVIMSSENEDGPAHKKVKLKHLPTFASYEDIVSLINKKKRKSSRRT
ncbi:24301_t:CDS:2, partial [Gigaspora rosea]